MKTLEEAYQSLPKIACKRLCQDCCGPVIPAACLPQERVKLSILPLKELVKPDLTCGALILGSCSIYTNRPLICRLFGVIKAMKCPFGCEPERWMTDKEVEHILTKFGGDEWVGKLYPGQK